MASYASDAASIKKNSKAYAAYRDKVKWGTLKSEADPEAVAALKAGTTAKSGHRIGGFDQAGFAMGSAADELYYRMNKNGSVSMDDIKDMRSFGGRADKDGVITSKSGRQVKGGDNLFRSIEDMQASGDYKFDDDVISWAKGQRDAENKRRAPELARRAAKEKARSADYERRKAEARAAGKPFGSVEEDAAKRKAEYEKAKAEGPEALKALQDARAAEEAERRLQKRTGKNAAQRRNENSAATQQSKAREEARRRAQAKLENDRFKKKANETRINFAQNRKDRAAAKFNTQSFQEIVNNSSNQARNALPEKYDYKSNAQDSGAEKWNYQ